MGDAVNETGEALASPSATIPALGFLGVGWIGRSRMQAALASGAASALAISDPDADVLEAAAARVPGAGTVSGLEELLELEPDGIVIATPSALHADQAIAVLERGIPVFCQKPLGRDAREASAVVEAARRADRLLGVDLSYRRTRAVEAVRAALRRGDIGEPFAAELTFHNAYGPDKAWFRRRELAGGGCLIDLGTHLVDLLHLLLDGAVEVRTSRVLRSGRPLAADADEVEDYAVAELLRGEVLVRLACSWWLSAGRDCAFEVVVHGTEGALAVENVAGSFHDLRAERREGTATRSLAEPPDEWGGRALVAFAQRLARDRSFDPTASGFVEVSRTIDAIYARAS